ncbi:hypothetical protein IIW_00089 [Bacillus cereus VD136]|nr:hypothetical protein IIW_00089 [Bacillus cereus VD136]EOP75561.1 hypothetical protein KOW_02415 [Bacillus cereus VDM006]
MIKSLKYLFFSLSLFVLLVGCQNQTSQSEEPKKPENQPVSEKKKEETKEQPKEKPKEIDVKLPQTMEEFSKFPVGEYGKLSFDERENKEIRKKVADKVEDHVKKIGGSSLSKEELKKAYIMELFKLTKREFPEYKLDYNPNIQSTPKDESGAGTKQALKENLNVEIIIDSSGSMAGKVDGKTKMEVAKEAVRNFAKSLPKEANVSLVAYGHKGSNKEQDKEASCGAIDTVYSRQAYQEQSFQQALDQFQSTGWTPLAGALQKSMDNFASAPGEKNTNIIYVVSDGIETCGGDPVAVAKQLGDSNIQPIVNVIGFDVDNESQQQLKQVAEATKGKYVSVKNTKELESEFQKGKDLSWEWSKWKTDASWDVSTKATDIRLNLLKLENEWKSALSDQEMFVSDITRQLVESNEKQKEVIVAAKEELVKYIKQFDKDVLEKYLKDTKKKVDEIEKKKEAEINETYKKNKQ